MSPGGGAVCTRLTPCLLVGANMLSVYINLPIGAVAIAIILFFIKLPNPPHKRLTLREQFHQLDPLGTLCFLPGIVCLLLALQWGGTTYAWSNSRIIALLVLFGVLIIAFVAIQIWKQETATVPPRIFKQRTILAGTWWTLCVGGSMISLVYYLPIWFQAIKGVTAEKSGIMSIPLVLSLVIGSMGAGFLTRKIGYYTPWIFASAVIMPIGAGMLTTFKTNTGHSEWIGYQVLYGFGLGLGMQQANVGVQCALDRKDVPTGASLVFLCQSLGGSIFVSVANNIFDNKLAQGLQHIAGLNPAQVVNIGATELRSLVKPSLLPQVLEVYNAAIVNAFYVAVAVSCTAAIGAVFMPWLSVKNGGPGGGAKALPGGSKPEGVATGPESEKV
jgi:Major Facilitator Superfamily